MPRQIPHGEENLVCPFHKETCDKVCHRCPLWVLVVGKNPQSNEEINQWQCAIGWLPMLLVENSQQQRQTAAAVESLRNKVVQYGNRNSNPPPLQVWEAEALLQIKGD